MLYGYQYIRVAVDYVSKWVEVIACKVVIQFLKETVFAHFGIPYAIINDGGKHFCNPVFVALMEKYFITHEVTTPYHP